MEADVTTCFRHPKVETYVRCTRCDRYICPDCMREAAVGHQCVECVKEGHRSIRQARTVFGGKIAGSAVPVVTYTLIALNVLAYLGELVRPAIVDQFGMLGHGLMGADGTYYLYETPFPGYEAVGVAAGEWYRLITAAFLHMPPGSGTFGILHIVLNMYGLWNLGPVVEDQLGRARYLALYLLSALGGSVLVFLVAPQHNAVGASGAIFGLAASYYVINRRLNRDMHAAKRFLAGFVIWMVISAGFTSWQGHLGGLLSGAAVTAALAYAPAKHRTAVQAVAMVGVLVLLVVLAVLKSAELGGSQLHALESMLEG
ncbi:rhomboid family intramembrane serine protease [Streptomyces sp. SYSU K21746]